MKNSKINVTKVELPNIREYNKYLKKIWATCWVTNNGEFVQLLENKLEDYLDVNNLSLVSNGTLAIQLAIKALDIKGEIITTPFTFVATTNAIIWEGCTPVFADIDENTFNIDPKDVEQKITKNTVAILAVHVYGNPCNIEELERISKKYKIPLIFDAAHTFGVKYKGKSVLDYGDISTLSFHATKIFNTIEGGAVIARNNSLNEKIKLLRNFGIETEDVVSLPGINAKMNEFQAIMGICNLENINKKILLRKKIYGYYKEKLNSKIKFQELTSSRYNYSYMPICFKSRTIRDKVFKELLKKDIKTRKYFFPLTSKSTFFSKVTMPKLKNACKISVRVLCLPLYPSLKIKDVRRIIKIVNSTIKQG